MYMLFAIVGLVASALAKDLTVGHDGGRLIFEQNVTASPTLWRQERNLTVDAADTEVITQVIVIDNREDKNGEAVIVEGGEGHKNVTIELKSPAVFRGYDFVVKVYAESEGGQQSVIDQQYVNPPTGQVPKDDGKIPKDDGKDPKNDGQVPNEEGLIPKDDVNKGQEPQVPASSSSEVPNGQEIQQPIVPIKDDVIVGQNTQVSETSANGQEVQHPVVATGKEAIIGQEDQASVLKAMEEHKDRQRRYTQRLPTDITQKPTTVVETSSSSLESHESKEDWDTYHRKVFGDQKSDEQQTTSDHTQRWTPVDEDAQGVIDINGAGFPQEDSQTTLENLDQSFVNIDQADDSQQDVFHQVPLPYAKY